MRKLSSGFEVELHFHNKTHFRQKPSALWWRWVLPHGSSRRTHLQSFALSIQAAAEPLVVGRQHVQLRPQGIVGRGRGLGDEAVDAVGQQLDLELLGVDFLLRPLVKIRGKSEVLFLRLQLLLLIPFDYFLVIVKQSKKKGKRSVLDSRTETNYQKVRKKWNDIQNRDAEIVIDLSENTNKTFPSLHVRSKAN